MLTERQKQKLFRHAIDTFNILLQQLLGRDKPYSITKTDISSWQKFTKRYEQKLCETFVDDFIKFGVNNYLNVNSRKYYAERIKFSWVIAGKVAAQFDNTEYSLRQYIVRTGIKKTDNVDTNTTPRRQLLIDSLKTIRVVEEKQKERYYGQNRGFLWCKINTTLYNDKSKLCCECKFNEQCLITLKQNYSKVYKARGYGN
jgi:hypothetical protein